MPDPYVVDEYIDNAKRNLSSFGSWLKSNADKLAGSNVLAEYGNFLSGGGVGGGGLVGRVSDKFGSQPAPPAPSAPGFSMQSGNEDAARGPAVGGEAATIDNFVRWVMARMGGGPDRALALIGEDDGTLLKMFLAETAPRSGGGRGFAPQAKSSGTLANGQPYIFDPNLPAGQQFYNGLTGASLTPEEFKSVPKQQVSPITGNLLLIDDFGNVTDTGKKIGFAGTDPALTAAEDKRRFDVGEGGLNARSAADREAANQRSLLDAQTAGFQTVANLTPQLATAALNQAQFQRDVISSPADLAYRMFSTRGGTSPFPRVTQADLINNLASEIERYNQTLQAFRPGPVGFQPAPQAVPQTPAPTGFTAPPQAAPAFVEDGGSVAPVGGISPLTRPGTPSFVTGGSPAAIPPPPPGLSNPELWAQFAAGMQPQAAPQAAPQVVPQAVPQAAQQQTGFSVAPPTFQIPQIPVPQRTTQSEIRGFEQQTRPPAVQSILEGRMPKPLDLGFQLPTPMQYGALTPDERKAFGTTLAIQYDVSPEDFEDTIRRRFTAPQERRAQVVGF